MRKQRSMTELELYEPTNILPKEAFKEQMSLSIKDQDHEEETINRKRRKTPMFYKPLSPRKRK